MNLYHLEACEQALAAYHAAPARDRTGLAPLRTALQDAYDQLRSAAGHLRPVIQHRSLPRRARALIAECREGGDDDA